MKLDDLLKHIDKAWHADFISFIETGEADERFLGYLDSSPECQQAVDNAFTAQAEAFAGLASALDETSEPLKRREAASASLASGLESVLELPKDEQSNAIASALAAVRLMTKGRKKEELLATVERLEEEVSQG